MSDSELVLSTLTDAWHSGMQRFASSWPSSEKRACDCGCYNAGFWVGFTSGLAVAIATVSGLPSGSTHVAAAIQAGSDIARARRT